MVEQDAGNHDVVVIGASAGGVAAMLTLAAALPADLPAAVLVVVHTSPYAPSRLPELLSRNGPLPALHPKDGTPIERGRIYVAPPDHHLIVDSGKAVVRRGPKENRQRPAVDALFRSAAYEYGSRAIAVVLTGALDDGTSGAWAIKRRGGRVVVQEPDEAEFRGMPDSVLEYVEVDHRVPLQQMARVLVDLVAKPAAPARREAARELHSMAMERKIAMEGGAFESGILDVWRLTPYTCPECHGALVSVAEGRLTRFRCHTGHAFTASALLSGVTESTENVLWQAVQSLEEATMLLNGFARQYEKDQPQVAALFFEQARQTAARARIVHDSIPKHHQTSEDIVPKGRRSAP